MIRVVHPGSRIRILILIPVFLSQELGADPAGTGAAAQAERKQRHSLHQAGPRLTPLRQGVRPGLSRQIRPVGERFGTTRIG